MEIVDQFHDPALGTLYREMRVSPDLYEMAKTAEMDAKYAESLPDTAFAWPEERRFPIHEKPHAALSIMYARNEKLPNEVMTRLKEAAEVFEIPLESFQVKEA